ncbi:MAG TPA: class I SAM-dependent methyltransferase [Thermoanaerobaculia bacterium]|jgi:2-polyprenyl-3-methyl-5-hydroxy-6-metoxy-1,4-benzoquinol methylase|nr:class I SAM-dependent methyltransferase [Thermoanaerobaculia bacterium]
MTVAVLFPRYDHPAIEERYASWQAQMLLRQSGAKLHFYDPEEPASFAAAAVESEYALVVTDPLLVPPANMPRRLVDALLSSGGAQAALPVTNESANDQQRTTPLAPYMTLRELQLVTARMQARPADLVRIKWDRADPGAFLCATTMLDAIDDAPRHAIAGREIVIARNEYAHRWSSLRGQVRYDLLGIIDREARSILEFGCGEAPLGEALKKRQPCRVVGVELDQKAAAVARRRIDDVYCADVREIIAILDEQFDWIVGGDIVEHLDEPWSFLADLRRVCKPGGKLLLSLPNISNASVVNDLLHGRFDYVYMGLTCVGHLRFFTRRTIEEMLSIAGWAVDAILPQQPMPTPPRDELLAALDAAGIAYSKDDLIAPGYYVIARHP